MACGDWANKAALFELLSMAFGYTARETAEVVASGEYAEALSEAVVACGLGDGLAGEVRSGLAGYIGRDADEVWHGLRVEYTRLFVGTPETVVSPFAGIWYAEGVGVDPLLFVNKESMAVERAMLGCGMRRPEGTNEPLDHIATECEFLNYLCLVHAGALEGVEASEGMYESFYSERFAWWKNRFAEAVLRESHEGLLLVGARVLMALPEAAL